LWINPHTENSLREVVAQNRTGLDNCKEGRNHKNLKVENTRAKGKGRTTAMSSRGCTTPVLKGRTTTVLKGLHHTNPQGLHHNSSQPATHVRRGAAATTANTPTADERRAAAKREDPLTLEAQEQK
jgi:hypothetical protein